ncbi:MAG: 50S ribosomal protein L10 [Theionarchaea archaeon]|nr:50S ribosomal protein L10 [Theionarchaea archaeon]
MAHVSASKKEEVKTLISLIDSYPVVGVVDIEGIKARQLQKIRHDLREKAHIRASKNTLLAIALKKSEKNVKELASSLENGASLICSNTDPFQLNMLLEKGKTPALARPGDIAPEDIVISAGDTGFPPGPLVGELQRAGVPARIEKGAIIVQKDCTFVKAGETISEKQAEILRKLAIEPMTVGLKLLGVCENDMFFEPSVLHVDIDDYQARIGKAFQDAFNLGVEACIMITETITPLLQKAVRYSQSLALEAGIISKGTLPRLIAKANAHAQIINSLVTGEPIAAPSTGEPSPKEEASREQPEEEESTEEEALDGLGSLFG